MSGAASRIGLAGAAAVVAPFGLGYFFSYLYRTVNGVVGPDLAASVGLDAAGLGLLTSAYFMAFAAFQVPLGVLLDRYGPRRVAAILLLVAAAGALVFANGQTLAGLAFGRALIGLGVSASLMAAMTANAQWMPPERLALANSMTLAIGGLGAITATAPAQAALAYTDWRGLFTGLAIATVAAAAVVFVAAPDAPVRPAREGWGAAFRSALGVYREPVFQRVAPLAAIAHGSFLAYQGLWAAAWLRDVEGLERASVGAILAAGTSGIILGTFASGFAADRLARRGVPAIWVAAAGTAAFILVQVGLILRVPVPDALMWGAYCFFAMSATLTYAVLSRAFPAGVSGRVNTALNLAIFLTAFLVQSLVGSLLAFWPTEAGRAPAVAHATVMAGLVVLQACALAWLLVPRRERAALA